MAVPDKRFTFDKERPSTTVEHLEADHVDGGAASRWSHYLEFARFVFFPQGGDTGAIEDKAAQMMANRFSIHFHVWSGDEFRRFLAFIRERHVPQLELVEFVRNGDEGIFVIRKV